MVRANAGDGPQTRSLAEDIAILVPLILVIYINSLNEYGGPTRAAVKGVFCLKTADFAQRQLAETPLGMNFNATPFMQ